MSNEVYSPGEVDVGLLTKILSKHGLTHDSKVLMLPFGPNGQLGREKRLLYFWAAVAPEDMSLNTGDSLNSHLEDVPKTRIVSFGRCNVACPYCKRDCQFIDSDGIPIVSVSTSVFDLASICEGAVGRGETVRFSGGDPIMYSKEVLALSEYVFARHGKKVSIAHNGQGPRWVSSMLPYLSSAAIDLKGVPQKLGKIMGIFPAHGVPTYNRSLKTQSFISHANILLDVRTPIFGDTTLDEMLQLAEDITQKNNLSYTFWTWRLYSEVNGCDFAVPEKENVQEMMLAVSARYPKLWLGLRAKWERGGMIYVKGGQILTG